MANRYDELRALYTHRLTIMANMEGYSKANDTRAYNAAAKMLESAEARILTILIAYKAI